MKKIIALIVAVMVAAAGAGSVFAHSDQNSLGSVPKTAVAPVIDGVKDDIYNEGLYIPIKNPHSATPDGGLGGGAEAWVLWDDDCMYIFIDVKVAYFYVQDDYQDKQVGSQWDLTTVEIIVDFTNATDDPNEVTQFRMDDSGYPNATFGRNTPQLVGDECKPYIGWGSVKGANSYTAEFKIDYKACEAQAKASDITSYGSAYGAGKQIGFYLFAQEIGDGESALFISNPTDRSGNWVPDIYDYIVLGDNVVGAPAPAEPEPEPAAPEAPPPAVQEPEPAAPAPEAPQSAAPVTGDGLAFAVLTAFACAGLFMTRRRAKN
ncbi:MAG: hypothetical protein FWD23_13370 [Oscillospiraceae bacterium]|nr:hypothetical protein [Oscillospiraceae bacterium]